MDLINERFNDWNQEVMDRDYQISLLLRQKLNNALNDMIPSQDRVFEKVKEKTCVFIFTDRVFLAVREYHREPRHG